MKIISKIDKVFYYKLTNALFFLQGLPLHLQIDTFDDPRDSIPVFHRGYCQVKVFCDKVRNISFPSFKKMISLNGE